jgi:hypothetical protein
VTSVDNPLPVDPDTLYVLGSVTKTQTATALMRLVASGQVELEAPARRYVPDLRLKDEQAAFAIVDGPPVRERSYVQRSGLLGWHAAFGAFCAGPNRRASRSRTKARHTLLSGTRRRSTAICRPKMPT